MDNNAADPGKADDRGTHAAPIDIVAEAIRPTTKRRRMLLPPRTPLVDIVASLSIVVPQRRSDTHRRPAQKP
jgi:hypothetical protein